MSEGVKLIISFVSLVFLVYIFIVLTRIESKLKNIKIESTATIDCKKINKNYPPGICKLSISL